MRPAASITECSASNARLTISVTWPDVRRRVPTHARSTSDMNELLLIHLPTLS